MGSVRIRAEELKSFDGGITSAQKKEKHGVIHAVTKEMLEKRGNFEAEGSCEGTFCEDVTADTRAVSVPSRTVHKRLVMKAVKGDRKAIGKIITFYYQDILYFAVKKVGKQEGEDVAQQAITRIISNVRSLKDPDKIKPWIMTIVYNMSMSHMKKRAQTKITPFDTEKPDEEYNPSFEEQDHGFLPERALIDAEQCKEVIEVIDTLPENYADCLRLYYYEEMSYQEIGEVLGLNWHKVHNNLHRGKMLFKKRYEKASKEAGKLGIATTGVLPLLSHVFEVDKAQTITPEMTAHLLEYAQQQVGTLFPSHFPSPALQGVTHASGKLIAGAALVAATGIGVGAYAISNQQQEVSAPAASVAVSSVEEADKPEVFREEHLIETVADMIGLAEAEQLETYCGGSVDLNAWQTFLTHIDAKEERRATGYDYCYAIQVVEQQDKQLVLFSREDKASGNVLVRYRFGSAKEIPLMTEVALMF